MAKSVRFAICVSNAGVPASLELRKVYRLVSDPAATSEGLVRVVDESGEDYLYPDKFFVPIEVPKAAARAFSKRSA
jgi:hypothetical protein